MQLKITNKDYKFKITNKDYKFKITNKDYTFKITNKDYKFKITNKDYKFKITTQKNFKKDKTSNIDKSGCEYEISGCGSKPPLSGYITTYEPTKLKYKYWRNKINEHKRIKESK